MGDNLTKKKKEFATLTFISPWFKVSIALVPFAKTNKILLSLSCAVPATRECTAQHTQLQHGLSWFVTALPCWNHLRMANFNHLGHLLSWVREAIRIFARNTITSPWHLNTYDSWGFSLGGWPCWTQVGMVRTCTTPMLYWVSVGKREETVIELAASSHKQGAVKTPSWVL